MYRRKVVKLLERGRRWASTGKGSQAKETVVSASERRAAPGFVRVRKGFEADKHEAEVDSTLARIIGSDWGDRSHQPVSLAMRLYWVAFGIVVLNGLYTYFAGKDESFLVEKLKKKADEKLGVVEDENEFEEMAESHLDNEQEEKPVEKTVALSASASTLASGAAPSGMPFFSPAVTSVSNAHPVKTKPELEQQLQTLMQQQERLKKQATSSSGAQKEELEHQVRMIDIQKEQVKQLIKRS